MFLCHSNVEPFERVASASDAIQIGGSGEDSRSGRSPT